MGIESRADSLYTRESLLELIKGAVQTPLVLGAFAAVDRADFVPPKLWDVTAWIYQNRTIPLGDGASISEPVLSARMVDYLRLTGEERVLEIGTGSGYLAAILSHCAGEVHTVEYDEELAIRAFLRLSGLKLGNRGVYIHIGDGVSGVPQHAPFDAIIVTAAAREIPNVLVEQLALGGRMVLSVGKDPDCQRLVVVTRQPEELEIKTVDYVSFHRLISCQHGGWTEELIDAARIDKWRMIRSFKAIGNLRLLVAEALGIPPNSFSDEDLANFGSSPPLPDRVYP